MKKSIFSLVVLLVISAGVAFYFSPEKQQKRLVERLIDKNIEARGGSAAWEKANALLTRGKMDVGNGVHLAYSVEQLRPEKMCISYVFKEARNFQCTNGKQGWKSLPFKGRGAVETLTENEMQEFSGLTDPFGLLYQHDQRHIQVTNLGTTKLGERKVHKLKITTPLGAERILYLDDETGLEVKMESKRMLHGKERLVETWYKDWQATDGLLISRRIESRTDGDRSSHFITVEQVEINPAFEAERFDVPADLVSSQSL